MSTPKRKRYAEQVAVARALSHTQLKRILRKLVKDSVRRAWELFAYEPNDDVVEADRIAKELVP